MQSIGQNWQCCKQDQLINHKIGHGLTISLLIKIVNSVCKFNWFFFFKRNDN